MSIRTIATAFAFAGLLGISGGKVAIAYEPSVVVNAARREAIKQDTTWTSENIQSHPYLFIQDQILCCDKLKAKIEAHKITLIRMGKQAARTIEESDGAIARYTNFLTQAKTAYKEAEKTDKWPVVLNGFELNQEDLEDRIVDALERIELAKRDKIASVAIGKKVKIRQSVLKSKARELQSTRLKLVQQGEQVKMNAELAKIAELTNVLNVIKDMTLEIEEDPTKLSVEDLTSTDSDGEKKRKIRAFLAK